MNRKLKIGVQTLVKNEAKFIWYSTMSIFDYVDRIRIWDMGSTDFTRTIIDKILDLPTSEGKVFYEDALMQDFDESSARDHLLEQTPLPEVYNDENFFPWTREKMLKASSSDWIIIVDADEVWWDDSIKKLTDFIREHGDDYESIVVPAVIPVGDIFHRQEEAAGRYRLAGRTGHYALRAINRRIPGLHSRGKHGVWGWVDENDKMIQDRDPKKIAFLDTPYMHFTHLQRAGGDEDKNVVKRVQKYKHELGKPFPLDYYYPEVFFKKHPPLVESPWQVMTPSFKFKAYFETPLRKIKRRVWWGKPGY